MLDENFPDRSFPKSVRLRQQAEFDRVYQTSAFAADETLVIRAAANDLGRSRLGLAVSRKVGNAVVRNRWKRLIREAFRNQRATLPVGLDIVVRPRKGAGCDYDAIFDSLPKLMKFAKNGFKKNRIEEGRRRELTSNQKRDVTNDALAENADVHPKSTYDLDRRVLSKSNQPDVGAKLPIPADLQCLFY